MFLGDPNGDPNLATLNRCSHSPCTLRAVTAGALHKVDAHNRDVTPRREIGLASSFLPRWPVALRPRDKDIEWPHAWSQIGRQKDGLGNEVNRDNQL